MENYQYLGIMEVDIFKQTDMKEKKTRKNYFIRTRNFSKTSSCIRKGNLKCEPESLEITEQNNAIMTNDNEVIIDNRQQNSK